MYFKISKYDKYYKNKPFHLLVFGTPQASLLQKINEEHLQLYAQLHEKCQDEAEEKAQQ